MLKQNLDRKSEESTELTSQISKSEEEKRSCQEEVEKWKAKSQFQDVELTEKIATLVSEKDNLEKLFRQEKEKYTFDCEQKTEEITDKFLSLEAANKLQICENEKLKILLKTSEEQRSKFEQEFSVVRKTLEENVEKASAQIESQISEIEQLGNLKLGMEQECTRLQKLTSQLQSDSEILLSKVSDLESDKEKHFQTIRELSKELHVNMDEFKKHFQEDRLRLLELIKEGEVKLERVTQEWAADKEMVSQLEVEKRKEIDALKAALDNKTRELENEKTSMTKIFDWYEDKSKDVNSRMGNLEQNLVRKSQEMKELQNSLSRKTNEFEDLSQRFQSVDKELQRSKLATEKALEELKKSLQEENQKV